MMKAKRLEQSNLLSSIGIMANFKLQKKEENLKKKRELRFQ